MKHRQAHPSELEPRFCRPVEPLVAHRLSEPLQACLELSLARVREAHQRIHEASAVLAEAIQAQQFPAQARAAGRLLQAAAAATEQAQEVLR